EPRALAFLMSGLPVRGADALALGLADCTILAGRMAEVRSGIAAAAAAGNVETALVSLMQAESIEPGPAEFSALADRLADCFGAVDAGEIVAAVTRTAAADPTVATLAEALASRSPTSLEAIVQSHRRARVLQDVEPILALDLRLARLLSERPDFAEGVRALLVDKDQQPRWDPAGFTGVPRSEIAAAVGGEEVLVRTSQPVPVETGDAGFCGGKPNHGRSAHKVHRLAGGRRSRRAGFGSRPPDRGRRCRSGDGHRRQCRARRQQCLAVAGQCLRNGAPQRLRVHADEGERGDAFGNRAAGPVAAVCRHDERIAA